jgi:hypothetical protein
VKLKTGTFEFTQLSGLDSNYNDFDTISGKTPPIFKEIWVFPNLNGKTPPIIQSQ